MEAAKDCEMRLQSSPTDGWSALWADPANYLAKIHKTL